MVTRILPTRMPNSPARKRLITKLRAQITFTQAGPTNFTGGGEPNALIMAVTVHIENEWQLYVQERGNLMKPTYLLEKFPGARLRKGPQLGLQPSTHNGRSQTWGSPC